MNRFKPQTGLLRVTLGFRTPILVGSVLLWVCPGARAGLVYKNGFTTLSDLSATGGVTLQVGPAPGGKAGNALQIMNPGNVSNSGATLAPSVGLPGAATFVFCMYIASHTGFQAVYTYPPGEGLRFMTGGLLQGSCSEGYSVSW